MLIEILFFFFIYINFNNSGLINSNYMHTNLFVKFKSMTQSDQVGQQTLSSIICVTTKEMTIVRSKHLLGRFTQWLVVVCVFFVAVVIVMVIMEKKIANEYVEIFFVIFIFVIMIFISFEFFSFSVASCSRLTILSRWEKMK